MLELTIEQACKHPANFLYIWADEQKFLRYIPTKYASIIRVKKANENKLLDLSAEKYGSTKEAYTNAIREAFIKTYGITPAAALVKLAKGEQVAGKNWKEGVFGIGATGTTFSQNKNVTVDPKTGHILLNGQDTYKEGDDVLYADVNGKTVAYQYYYTAADGTSYSSQRNSLGKYFAARYSDKDGNLYDANGKATTEEYAADIWGNIIMAIESFINWLLSLFGTGKETLNADNTLPSQTADGFVTESGVGEAGGILLLLAAGGAAIAMGGKGKKGKKMPKARR